MNNNINIKNARIHNLKGMCVKCLGKGVVKWIDADKLFADKNQHIYDIACGLGKKGSTRNMLEEFCSNYGMNLWEDKLSDLTEEQIDLLKYGDGGKIKTDSRYLSPQIKGTVKIKMCNGRDGKRRTGRKYGSHADRRKSY